MVARRRRSSTPAPPLPRTHQRRAPVHSLTDHYRGYLPKDGEVPAKESIDNLDRDKLWHSYISCRRPVVIDGLIKDEEWKGDNWNDLLYLRKVAGNAVVKIEPVDAAKDQFGTGAKRKVVSLSVFLDMLEDEEQAGKWYLTTQYEPADEDDQGESASSLTECIGNDAERGSNSADTNPIDESLLPSMEADVTLPAPTDALAHLFPLPGPEIMGDLVLQQCNLWMGNGESGKSSGLHHDYHDNLYMLLSGRKRFLIWPPLAHRWLEPVGRVETVHVNGLIEYGSPGELPVQADGLNRLESAHWLFRARVRSLLEADERAARNSGEDHVVKGLRKGKGRQTADQEIAIRKLHEAQVQLLLLQAEDDSEDDDDEESDLVSTAGSLNTVSDLFDQEVDSGDDYDNFSDDNDGRIDESDPGEVLGTSLDAEDNMPYSKQKTGKRLHNGGTNSEEGDEEEILVRTKRRRESVEKLVIPQRGLPGGFRGSLQDPEGDLNSDSDEFADEDIDEGNIYSMPSEGLEGENLADDDEEEMLLSLANRSRVLSRMQAMSEAQSTNEQMIEGTNIEEGAHEVSGGNSESDDAEDGNGEGLRDYAEGDSEEGGSDAESIGSWPSLDEDDLEDGEQALAELARLQDEKDGGTGLVSAEEKVEDDDPRSFSKIAPRVMQWYFRKPADPAVDELHELQAAPDNGIYLLPRQGCPPPVEVHLHAGQMLYLPASWYHEVTSYTNPDEKPGVHMALNYWFHPPTAVRQAGQAPLQTRGGSNARSSGPDVHQPYLDSEVWDEIRRCVNQKVEIIRSRARQAASQTATI